MPKIRPVSDLRNYSSILSDVTAGEPVYLTKNGRGTYAIIDIEDQERYEKAVAYSKLMEEIGKGIRSYTEHGTVSSAELRKRIKNEWTD